METAIQKILETSDIAEAAEIVGEYNFRLQQIERVLIRIRLFERPGSNEVWFEQSHHIKTPTQASPYRTSRPSNANRVSALSQAVSGITMYYKEAVAAGHSPDESWLIRNDYF